MDNRAADAMKMQPQAMKREKRPRSSRLCAMSSRSPARRPGIDVDVDVDLPASLLDTVADTTRYFRGSEQEEMKDTRETG